MRAGLVPCALMWAAAPAFGPALLSAAPPDTTLTIVAFSDYHSHAVPSYSEGKAGQGGVARALAYLKTARARPNTLVVSGGDTMNLGTPTWSDEYRCLEWPWFNGLVDVMALGNHDFDYGSEEFARCRAGVTYPILGANLVGEDGTPFLLASGKPYLVKEVGGVRIGLFAVCGPDIKHLIKKELLPANTRWEDGLTTARSLVKALREVEKADAVVFIGHQLREDDEVMARAVPGIDLILGTHSHYKGALRRIEGATTYYVSPYQYLAYVSKVNLVFRGGRLAEVTGGLVKMDETQQEDRAVAAEVARLQKALQAKRPDHFLVLGRAQVELSDANLQSGESVIGNWATDALRRAARTHAFFSTASSFRAAIPPGDVTAEAFYAAIPYKNRLVTAEMTGREIADWLSLSASKAGSDGFSQASGVRYALREGRPTAIEALKDPERPEAGFAPLDPAATYKVGTTDFQAKIAAGYKELFAAARSPVTTDLDAHEVLIAALRAGPVTARLDGRTGLR